MNEQNHFFTPQHERLLNIATWAKHLAWVALVVAFLLPIAKYIELQNLYDYQSSFLGQSLGFFDAIKNDPLYGFAVFTDVLDKFLSGFIAFLVLKGISLGLNMIVETDVNYRENKGDTE